MTRYAPWTIEQACRSILGHATAAAIINDQGVHWAVVAAMAKALTSDDPRALKAIRDWNAEQKRADEASFAV